MTHGDLLRERAIMLPTKLSASQHLHLMDIISADGRMETPRIHVQ